MSVTFRIPRAHDNPSVFWIVPYGVNDLLQLINTLAAVVWDRNQYILLIKKKKNSQDAPLLLKRCIFVADKLLKLVGLTFCFF